MSGSLYCGACDPHVFNREYEASERVLAVGDKISKGLQGGSMTFEDWMKEMEDRHIPMILDVNIPEERRFKEIGTAFEDVCNMMKGLHSTMEGRVRVLTDDEKEEQRRNSAVIEDRRYTEEEISRKLSAGEITEDKAEEMLREVPVGRGKRQGREDLYDKRY